VDGVDAHLDNYVDPEAACRAGVMIDLACAPAPASPTREPRFLNHGDYVNAFMGATNGLLKRGFLLAPDAEAMKALASQSSVGSREAAMRRPGAHGAIARRVAPGAGVVPTG
jgi:hypothetical protein